MYIMGENPAMSDPDVQHAREALGQARSPRRAGHLPHRDGEVCRRGSPRLRLAREGRHRIEHQPPGADGAGRPPLPGQARQDLDIIIELANRLGCDWRYAHVSEVFAEMAAAMPSLNNITWERVAREYSVTYPCDAPDEPGQDIVFGNGFPTATGRAKFVPAQLVSPAEEPDTEYPFVLTTGRQLEHWHTGSMTRRSQVLDDLEPEAVAYVSARDMERLGANSGEFIQVSTRRGAIQLKARIDGMMPPGMIFIPFAYAEAAANVLTNPQLDPFGKIPEFKFCACRMERASDTVLEAAE
jgi:formate dehydrogenase major subunit